MALGGLLVSLAENKKADLNFKRHSVGARFTKKQRQETMKPVYLILAKLIIKQITTQTSAIIRPGIWEPLRLPELLFW